MGVYAETHFEIECKNNKIAQKVKKLLEAMTKKSDKNGNSFGAELEVSGNSVLGFENSGRWQNLEYRVTEIWKAVKKIDGVVNIQAPVLTEGESMYFEKE